MNAQQLKNSILQMAVQGKLVPQDPNDEPASVLLERIRKEKEQLIKEGKIKKERNPSYIFRGADNTPYEKIGNQDPVSIADEMTFEIPKNWEWVRIGTMFNLQAGKSIPSSEISSTEYPGSFPCFGGNGLRGYVDHFNRDGYYPLIGRQGALCGNINFVHGQFYATEHAVVVETFGGTNVTWAGLFLEAMNLNQYATATAQPGLAVANINKLLIPVPPVQEQDKIVLKYRELVPYVHQYDQTEKRLTELNNKFPIELKKSILQLAVQGKLVPQDPADEPASVLLARIRVEKERLIKEGKIKRDKNESVIFRRDNSHYEKLGSEVRCIDDEIPFDIPDSWGWCRVSTILSINPRNQLSDDTVVGFMPMPLLEDGFSNHHAFGERLWKDVKSGFTHFKDNDVVVAKITPCFQNRKSAVISGLPNGYGAGTTELHVLRDETHNIYMPYVLLICKTQAFITGGVAAFTGTAGQQRVGKDYVANYLLPLPPMQEQIRIINVTQTILSALDELL